MQPEITVSIVNTNNRDVAVQCLESIYAACPELSLEIIVVNNACEDGSSEAIRDQFPNIKIIDHPEMLGFSTNNNLAFNQASGRYLMLLNDDTIVQPGTFQIMLSYMDENPTVGVIGATLLNLDGSKQKSYDHSPHPLYDGLQPLSEILFPLPKAGSEPLEVANVSGACMMVRTEVANQVGFLDPRFDPLYSEEVDWCYRINKAGWKIIHHPGAKVIHLLGLTMNRNPVGRYERIFEKKALFFRKHHGPVAVFLYKISLFAVNIVKSIAWTILWLVRKKEASTELKIHYNMVRKALFL
jgi:GT2 family glycosyltransferase